MEQLPKNAKRRWTVYFLVSEEKEEENGSSDQLVDHSAQPVHQNARRFVQTQTSGRAEPRAVTLRQIAGVWTRRKQRNKLTKPQLIPKGVTNCTVTYCSNMPMCAVICAQYGVRRSPVSLRVIRNLTIERTQLQLLIQSITSKVSRMSPSECHFIVSTSTSTQNS